MIKKALVGAHISISGEMYFAFDRAESIGCTAMQIFTKNGRSWSNKKLNQDQIAAFKKRWKQSKVEIVVAHASYLINIGSNKADVEKKSITTLGDELERCNTLGIQYLVLHPGSHLGAGTEKCIKQIAENIDCVFEKYDGSTKILLETMAGQGTNIGSTFEELNSIRQLASNKRKIGFCLDTCHIFSAGYNLSDDRSYEEIIQNFDKILGINNLNAIHINDSKTLCGSHLDRHESIGKGSIPIKIFELIMKDSRLINIPKILETPNPEIYHEEIMLLKKMAMK